jgi:hypothetical protein
LTLVVPFSRQILMQLARGDIGQLTDFEAIATAGGPVSGLRDLDPCGGSS